MAAHCLLLHDRLDVRLNFADYDCANVHCSHVTISSDAISFSAVFVWCAFQTGNTLQVRLLLSSMLYLRNSTSLYSSP